LFCAKCGSTVENGVKFCPACGENMIAAAAAPAPAPTPAPAPAPAQSYAPPPPPAYTPPAPAYQPPPSAYQAYPPYQNPALREPLSVGAYILTYIVFCIPVVGFIMMLVWAFSADTNINKKNLCRAMLILALIGVVLGIISSILFASVFATIFSNMDSSYYY